MSYHHRLYISCQHPPLHHTKHPYPLGSLYFTMVRMYSPLVYSYMISTSPLGQAPAVCGSRYREIYTRYCINVQVPALCAPYFIAIPDLDSPVSRLLFNIRLFDRDRRRAGPWYSAAARWALGPSDFPFLTPWKILAALARPPPGGGVPYPV